MRLRIPVLVAGAALLVVVACGESRVAQPGEQVVNASIEGDWSVTSADTPLGSLADIVPGMSTRAQVSLADGEFGGQILGGNNFGGSYALSGDTLELTDVGQTLGSCMCPLDQLEGDFGVVELFSVSFPSTNEMVWTASDWRLTPARQ